MPTIAEYVADYKKGAADLRAAVAGMTREQLTARPIAGKWSTLEVVAHLADFDPIYADRMKRVIALDNPSLLAADENLFAAALHYQTRDIAEELDLIDATRASMSRILVSLNPEHLSRTGTHSERGVVTLEQLLQSIVKHVKHHLTFIEEKQKALGM